MIGRDPGTAPARPFENWNLNEPERSTSFTMGIVGYVLRSMSMSLCTDAVPVVDGHTPHGLGGSVVWRYVAALPLGRQGLPKVEVASARPEPTVCQSLL
jgi:hypothetical protein